MKAGGCAAVAMFALLATVQGELAAAQADAHARAQARAACQSGKQAEAVTAAAAALERDPNELGPRLRLADALVDQGCYQEAVDVLEAGQQAFPRSRELSGKLRDVRSLVTEQTYIEGLTQAAEGAKFQRNQLRCTRLADVAACDDALKFKPDDAQLLLAKGDALMQSNRPTDAATAYRHAAQSKPSDEAIKTKLAAAESLAASTALSAASTSQVASANSAAGRRPQKRAPGTGSAPSSALGGVAGGAPDRMASTAAGNATGTAAGSASAAPGVAGATSARGATTVANTRGAARPRAASSKNPADGSPATLAAADTPTRKATGAQLPGGQHLTTPPLATIASLEPQQPRTYSNDAPPGRTN